MKTIVITGSTRGIGYGLADAFLMRRCSVVVSGRVQRTVDEAVAALSAFHERDLILGQACDVRRFDQVQALWDAAKARFGRIDVWINNAGVNPGQIGFWELSPDQIREGTETNLLGVMNGSAVAIRGMIDQGSGAIYAMEGLGSNGRHINGLALYGTTKHALAYLTDALAKETKGTGVIVGAIRPGMVITELLTKPFEGKPAEWERAKKIFNLLAERVETVAPWIAQRVLSNTKSGVRIQWLTLFKVMTRLLATLFRTRDLFR